MRRLLLASLFATWLALPAQAGSPGVEPKWGPASTLRGADLAVGRDFAEPSVSPSDDNDDEDEQETDAIKNPRIQAAIIRLDNQANLLLLRAPSGGNCGEYGINIYGPVTENKRPLLLPICASDLRLFAVPGQPVPNLVFSVGDLADRVWQWTGKTWDLADAVESFKPFLPTRPPVSRKEWPARLKTLSGGYNVVEVLQEPFIREQLRDGLKAHYSELLVNLSVRSQWKPVSACVFLTGQAPHRGGEQDAILVVCADGSAHAAILNRGKRIVFSPADRFEAIPEPIRAFLAGNLDGTGAPALQGSVDFEWMK